MRALSTVADLLDMKGRTVYTIGQEASLVSCSKMMQVKGVSSLVVLGEDSKLAGLITSRDLLRVAAEGGRRLDDVKVADVMTKDLRTTTEDASIHDVENTMIQQRIRHLPVMEGDEIVGLITRIDVLRHYLDKQHALSRELEGYITGVYSAA